MSDAERLARAILSRVGEPGLPSLTMAVHQLGAREVLTALEHQRDEGTLGADLAARLAEADPAGELERAAAQGIRFLVPGDAEWPADLDELAHAPLLHERGGPPVGLWVKGPLDLSEVAEHAVAVVGSRSATTYGADVAGEIAAGLAREGHPVVSGAAFGIDQAAHRGALAVRGATVAVLACGPDRAYPPAHARLIDYIAQQGLVVTEAAPGCAPTRVRFLARNRVIAGLARGTVVVEAAIRSGALNTATWTAGLGRPTMGVPGPVTSAPSEGVHQLIRHRDALLVTRAEEVIEAVGPIGSTALAEPRAPVQPRDRITHVERQVLDAVPVHHAVTSTRIGRTAGISTDRARAALRTLLSVGLVERQVGEGADRWRLAPAAGEEA